MHPEIAAYLQEQRVGVLAVQMPDGTPHGATVHFVCDENSFTFYFQTSRESLKAKAFVESGNCKATYVIGVDESTMKTMQLDGDLRIISPDEKVACEKIYLAKFPEKTERAKDPKTIYVSFTPTWWRYSDFKRKEGKLVLTSA